MKSTATNTETTNARNARVLSELIARGFIQGGDHTPADFRAAVQDVAGCAPCYLVYISTANEKTGNIPSFSCLAGSTAHGYNGSIPGALNAMISRIPGTCAGCAGAGIDCPGCYAKRLTRYTESALRLALNTIIATYDPDAVAVAVRAFLYSHFVGAFRWNVSGDFHTAEYMRVALDLAKEFPEIHFGGYTKSETIARAIYAEIPANFVLQCSPWAGVSLPIFDLPQFIYDDHTDAEIMALPHCPAVDKDGKRTGITCAQCRHCYKAKRGDRWAVHAH